MALCLCNKHFWFAYFYPQSFSATSRKEATFKFARHVVVYCRFRYLRENVNLTTEKRGGEA